MFNSRTRLKKFLTAEGLLTGEMKAPLEQLLTISSPSVFFEIRQTNEVKNRDSWFWQINAPNHVRELPGCESYSFIDIVDIINEHHMFLLINRILHDNVLMHIFPRITPDVQPF